MAVPIRAKRTVQQWGNSLAVRIPATVARAAHFTVGQPVEITAADDGVLVKRAGMPKLTLAQKLAAFESTRAHQPIEVLLVFCRSAGI